MKKIMIGLLACAGMILLGSGLKSTFVDPRDNQQYTYMKFGDAEWMTQNLRYQIPNDTSIHSYKKDPKNLRYGVFYKFDNAQVACPQGWRLASKSEWKKLIEQLPGRKNALQGRVVAYKQLRDSTNLNLPIAGSRSSTGQFAGYGSVTMFWTSSDTVWNNKENTQWNGKKYIGYHFYPTVRGNRDSLNAEPTFASEAYKNMGGYCRCVKN